MYIPAGLIEIYHQIKYQLANTNRSWDSTLDKNLNLVFTDVRTYGQLEDSMPWRAEAVGGGHKNPPCGVKLSVFLDATYAGACISDIN